MYQRCPSAWTVPGSGANREAALLPSCSCSPRVQQQCGSLGDGSASLSISKGPFISPLEAESIPQDARGTQLPGVPQSSWGN